MNENLSEKTKKVDIKVDGPETPDNINPENAEETSVEIPLEEMTADEIRGV